MKFLISGFGSSPTLLWSSLSIALFLSIPPADRQASAQDTGPQNAQEIEQLRQKFKADNNQSAARALLQNLYIGKQWSSLDQPQRNDLGRLLHSLNQASPADMGISQLYCDYLIAAEKHVEALPLLAKLAETQPMRSLQAAAILRDLTRDEEATQVVEETLQQLSELLNSNPRSKEVSLAVAHCQQFLQRHQDAIRTLNSAIESAEFDADKTKLRQTLREFDQTQASPSGANEVDQPNLTNAQSPRNSKHHFLLHHDRAFDRLQPALDRLPPSVAHYVIGTRSLFAGDSKTAIKHLEIARQLAPDNDAILNNLACAMSRDPKSDLQEALAISNESIGRTPNTLPQFYETRGQILFKLKRYAEAIPDLKRAITVPAIASNAHASLTECYLATGDTELAEKHRKAAEKASQKTQPE